jgi:predicted RND superfamily exporter protein
VTERGAVVARWLVRLGHRHPWLSLGGAVLVLAAGVGLGARLSFETDILSLMPRHDPVVQRFRQVLDEFGSLDTLLIAVPVQPRDNLDEVFSVVDELADELRSSPLLANVDAHLEDPVELADTVLRHALLFLDADGLAELGNKLQPAAMDARAADIRASLDTPHGMLAKDFAVRDPAGLLPLLLGRLSRAPSNLKIDYTSGYYLSEDHTMALILARPIHPAQDISFDQALFADLRPRVERARRRVAEELGIRLEHVPEVLLGGGHRIALEDASLIKRDIIVNSVTSIVGVMLLFFLAYRRLSTAHYAFLPLAVGLALTFAFTALALGRLNSATSGFAALLVGLGIDFTIVMYGRYLEARHSGLALGAALEDMADHSGPAVLLGAVTTVGTFFSFLVTRFVGLRELGLLTGTGIVFMALSSFLLLPALVTVFDGDRTPPSPSRWLNVVPILAAAGRHRRTVLTGALVVSLLAFVALPHVKFDDDARNLRSPSNRGIEIQNRVITAFGLSFNAMMVRVEAADDVTLMDRIHQLSSGLDRLVEHGVVSSYESLANLLPPKSYQERALAWVHAHRELTDPARVREELSKALARHGLVPHAFEPGFAALDEALRPSGVATLAMWQGTPVERFIERSRRATDGTVVSVINVFPPAGRWRRSAPPQLVELVATVPGAALAGVNVVSQRLRHTVWQDAGLAGGLGLVVVFLMLAWEFRRVGPSLLCLLPVALGVVWTVALMSLAGLPLNFLNVFVITMVIGVGVDYGIHILHRLRQGDGMTGLGETSRAVVFAMMTTIVGFGSLATTHYPGLQSIGWMTSLGVLFSCFGAVVVLPLLVRRDDDA